MMCLSPGEASALSSGMVCVRRFSRPQQPDAPRRDASFSGPFLTQRDLLLHQTTEHILTPHLIPPIFRLIPPSCPPLPFPARPMAPPPSPSAAPLSAWPQKRRPRPAPSFSSSRTQCAPRGTRRRSRWSGRSLRSWGGRRPRRSRFLNGASGRSASTTTMPRKPRGRSCTSAWSSTTPWRSTRSTPRSGTSRRSGPSSPVRRPRASTPPTHPSNLCSSATSLAPP